MLSNPVLSDSENYMIGSRFSNCLDAILQCDRQTDGKRDGATNS